jgi:hypothetical protein
MTEDVCASGVNVCQVCVARRPKGMAAWVWVVVLGWRHWRCRAQFAGGDADPRADSGVFLYVADHVLQGACPTGRVGPQAAADLSHRCVGAVAGRRVALGVWALEVAALWSSAVLGGRCCGVPAAVGWPGASLWPGFWRRCCCCPGATLLKSTPCRCNLPCLLWRPVAWRAIILRGAGRRSGRPVRAWRCCVPISPRWPRRRAGGCSARR